MLCARTAQAPRTPRQSHPHQYHPVAGHSGRHCRHRRRRLGIASGGQASSELLQVTRQLPQPRQVGGLVLHQLANLLDHILGAGPLMHRSAVTKFLYLALDLIGYGVGVVARFHLFAPPPIFGGVLLRVGHHTIDLLL